MKYVLTVFSVFILQCAASQSTFTYYYDRDYTRCSKDSAIFSYVLLKEKNNYSYTFTYVATGIVQSKGYVVDTVYGASKIGLNIDYNDAGIRTDSTYTNVDGNIDYKYHFYPSGKIMAMLYHDKNGKDVTSGFTEDGNPIPNFIFEEEADYPGGIKAWQQFIVKNINTMIAVNNKAPVGKYLVKISFVIDTNGNVINIKPITNYGYGTEQEAMRVIHKSTRWKPAAQYNHRVKAYRLQPITFVVIDDRIKN